MSRRGNRYDNAVIESWCSPVKSELGVRPESCGETKMELTDYFEAFYGRRPLTPTFVLAGRTVKLGLIEV
jgi:hypothetical protein